MLADCAMGEIFEVVAHPVNAADCGTSCRASRSDGRPGFCQRRPPAFARGEVTDLRKKWPVGEYTPTESRKTYNYDRAESLRCELVFFMCVFRHRDDLARLSPKLT